MIESLKKFTTNLNPTKKLRRTVIYLKAIQVSEIKDGTYAALGVVGYPLSTTICHRKLAA